MTPLEDLVRLSGRPTLDEEAGRAFIAAEGPRMLIFSGVEKKRPEAQDIAVIAREFWKAWHGLIEVAVLEGKAEDRLKAQFGVVVLPSLVLLGGAEPHVIPRVQDWIVYRNAFTRAFGAPPALAAE